MCISKDLAKVDKDMTGMIKADLDPPFIHLDIDKQIEKYEQYESIISTFTDLVQAYHE